FENTGRTEEGATGRLIAIISKLEAAYGQEVEEGHPFAADLQHWTPEKVEDFYQNQGSNSLHSFINRAASDIIRKKDGSAQVISQEELEFLFCFYVEMKMVR